MGAIERGEKNMTISTLYTITRALNMTISKAFERIA